MSRSSQIAHSLRQFISAHFLAARQMELGEHDSLLDSGVVDSLGVLDLVTFINTEWNVALDDEEMVSENFETIARLAALVDQRLPQEEAV